jgi:N-acetylglucosamine-6-sulfatase
MVSSRGAVERERRRRPLWRPGALALGVTVLALGLVSSACRGDHPSALNRAALPEQALSAQPDFAPTDPGPASSPADAGRPAHRVGSPNIVLVTTDDQNVSDMVSMPEAQRLLAARGTTFTALSPHPLCCPARAEILTGQYAQNNGVRHNHGAYGGFPRLDVDHTIATWLRRAGYGTAFVGKFLNEYDGARRPPGWTIWRPTTSRWYSYYGTRFYAGTPDVDDDGYSVDQVSDLTTDAIRQLARNHRPFFVWSSQVAPHGTYIERRWAPPRIAARHADRAVPDAPSLKDPALNIPGPNVRALAGERALHARGFLQHYFGQRARSLMAVDEAIETTVRALRRAGVLDNTYIFLTSDNGYLLGEHALVGKNLLYRQNLEVPLLIRGPDVRKHRTSAVPVTLADLAPTFLDIAKARADVTQDGTSFLPLLRGVAQQWRDTQLIQTGSRRVTGRSPGWSYRGVRTDRYTFGVHAASGKRLLFDRRRDPHELRNVAYEDAYRAVVAELSRRTVRLVNCAGKSCRRSFGPVPSVQPQAMGRTLSSSRTAPLLSTSP